MHRAAIQTAAGIGLGLGAAYLIGEAASGRNLIEPADGDETATSGSGVVADGGGRAPDESPDERTSANTSNTLQPRTRSDVTPPGSASRGGRYRRRRGTMW